MSEKAVLDVRVVEVEGYPFVAQFAFEVGGERFSASMSFKHSELLEVHLSRPHVLYLTLPATTPPSPLGFHGPEGADVPALLDATFGGPLSHSDYLRVGSQLRAVARLFVQDFQLAVPTGLAKSSPQVAAVG
jgi:hypothetical protein